MSELKLNLTDYKASGVYFVEVDNSVINTRTYNAATRLAVGFSTTGPFNRPVFLSSGADVTELFGGIDRRLERNGCFTNRNIRTMVAQSPIFAINLMPISTKDSLTNSDTVGYTTLSMSADRKNYNAESLYAYMYDRSRFWIADENAFVKNVFLSSYNAERSIESRDIKDAADYGLGNCGTKDLSVIVRKAEGLTGYNVTFLDWYGSADAIPYKWVNPNDYVSDYFVQVIAIAGKWDASTYESYATDPVWSAFFTKDGLKKEKVSKFLRLESVNVLGNWTGCILPNFLDKQGHDKSIDYLINKSCNTTGLLWGFNTSALDTLCLSNKYAEGTDKYGNPIIKEGDYKYFLDNYGDNVLEEGQEEAYFKIDPVGHMLKLGSEVNDFMSYKFDQDNIDRYIFNSEATDKYEMVVGETDDSTTEHQLDITQFAVITDVPTENDEEETEPAPEINVGDYVRSTKGLMSKIIKKRRILNDGQYINIFTALDPVKFVQDPSTGADSVEIHKNFTEMYNNLTFITLKGLKITNKHMPGYDENGDKFTESGESGYEKGVEKIYRMLEDEGIRKGLLNEDMIDFRYIVDTMAYGLGAECGAKKYLTRLAMEKGHCTALCNAPAMSQFANNDAPFFGDSYTPGQDQLPVFNIKYIPEGGNQDMAYSREVENFSLPTEENGAKNCAFFAPFLKYTEGSRTILVPPAADVSNTFVRRFIAGNPYATVANRSGIINNGQISDVEMLFDAEDRGYLEPFGINPIIMRQGNLMIYGDRTTYQTVNSDLSFLHVRELLNTLEISCKNTLDDYVFTYNIPSVRAEIVSRLVPILQSMKDCGALVKYEIQCDENNNTADIINEKFCIVDIGVWVSQNMEKIVTRITLNRSTTA